MNILAIHDGHNATACLMVDGEAVSSISEERLARKKNMRGYPRRAVDECLRLGGLSPREIDRVVLATKYIDVRLHEWLQDDTARKLVCEAKYWRPVQGVHEYTNQVLGSTLTYPVASFFAKAASRIRQLKASPNGHSTRPESLSPEDDLDVRIKRVRAHLDVAEERVMTCDHHTSHAYYAYFASPFRDVDTLVLTCDGFGDELNSTISVARRDRIERIHSQLSRSAIGWLYSNVTLLMGMTPDEHEYKVMGLAPYSASEPVQDLMPAFREFVQVEDLNFVGEVSLSYESLREALEGYRFDHIAGATQKLAEEVLIQWVRNAVRQTGVGRVVFSGGVAMNVKANMMISSLPEVDDLYVCASGGDESTAIGAAYWATERLQESEGSPVELQPLTGVYLGPAYSNQQIAEAIEQHHLREMCEITPSVDAAFIAGRLAAGQSIGRLAGRMEFGARALGNRSILADPSRSDIVRTINEQIKLRDFWMPFAPAILAERADDYLINPKGVRSPFMTLAFETTALGRVHLIAAIHPVDSTARPQIVERLANPEFWEIIKEFEKITGIGAILNTSFNLHGSPIVCSPDDAIRTFLSSRLDALLLEDTFISRRLG